MWLCCCRKIGGRDERRSREKYSPDWCSNTVSIRTKRILDRSRRTLASFGFSPRVVGTQPARKSEALGRYTPQRSHEPRADV